MLRIGTKHISGKVELATTALAKMRGLMFRKECKHALILELGKESKLGASIHMLFVFFPIDVVFLDNNRKVVDVVSNIQPFTLNVTPRKAAKYVVELPAGKGTGVRIGEVAKW